MGAKIILIALLGALGTLARYGLSGLVQNATGGTFPWGTFTVNTAGSFLFGLIWTLAEERLVISGEVRTIVLIGFMGAFTTFSSFSFETGELLRDSRYFLAIGNIFLNNFFCIAFLMLGFVLGRLF